MRERAKIGLKKPGLGLPLDYMPEKGKHFPILVGYLDEGHNWHAATLLIREACMLKVMEDLTNKPEWWVKVYNEVIIAKWRTEALVMDWTAYIPHADFTPLMFDAVRCIIHFLGSAYSYIVRCCCALNPPRVPCCHSGLHCRTVVSALRN